MTNNNFKKLEATKLARVGITFVVDIKGVDLPDEYKNG